MNLGELMQLLGKHKEAINARVNFVIDNAPVKLH
jgi:hypothetical protein